MVSYSTFTMKQKTYWSDNETCIISNWSPGMFPVIRLSNWGWYSNITQKTQAEHDTTVRSDAVKNSSTSTAWFILHGSPEPQCEGEKSRWKKNRRGSFLRPGLKNLFSLSKNMFSSFQMVSFMNIFFSLSSFFPLNRQHRRGKQMEVLNKTSC